MVNGKCAQPFKINTKGGRRMTIEELIDQYGDGILRLCLL